ncbi:MAG TPA: hypothetical protein VLZ33_08265, partial [Dysgonamonadaceae bacterium]|nr:hypothetical protein [Dysgonamonadaceae bacterium]
MMEGNDNQVTNEKLEDFKLSAAFRYPEGSNSEISLYSLCKKTPNTALLSFLKQSFTLCKLLDFKNFKSLVFVIFLSKTQKLV